MAMDDAILIVKYFPTVQSELMARSSLFLRCSACALLLTFGTSAQETQVTSESSIWDVNHPGGPTFDQIIDTREGTWMNVDVSPDGKSIAFDLLGDLYMMPIEGVSTEAKPNPVIQLTSGMAWDMQPRFSPDGKSIAFTSDRTGDQKKGGDNIWTLNLDTGDLTQITQESFRLLNNPAWSPDGDYLVARKHFTSRRSLGTGEIWMYHKSGIKGGATSGVALTRKTNEQKDINEPVFSPDGRYLYFSEDASPGNTFEYDKDSNGQIYVIHRLDLEKGERETLIQGPGGACRPTPSPDGQTLAFIRRLDGRSALHLYDLNSGAISILDRDMERDMQETWAIHGVYPAMAWTPDSESLVYWARGKLWRWQVKSSERQLIPFHIKGTREMMHPVRRKVDVAPETFPAKMLRWAQRSPDGHSIVFQALGHLYIKALPSGEPQRLTTQTRDFEFYPRFSPDGSHLVYTTWNDASLGTVRILALDEGPKEEGRVLSTVPGHYIDPVISPDGTKVVFERIGGGWLTSPLWSRDQGIFLVSTDGSQAPRRVTRRGHRPQFGKNSDRVFLQRTRTEPEADHRELFSVDLEGNDERLHVTSDWATEYSISGNGRWLAFIERFHVYVLPLVSTGDVVHLSPDQKALPMLRATEEAGQWIHFGSKSDTLHWTLGDRFYSLPISMEALSDPKDTARPQASATHIGMEIPHDQPTGMIALRNARVLSMTSPLVQEHQTILIEGNRIIAMGETDSLEIPEETHTMDLEGRMVMPGLIDTHAHGQQAHQGITPQQNWVDYARLAFGVTTVHDPSNETESIFAASELTKAGRITAPRTFSTGRILYGAAGHYKAEIDSLEDASFHLRRMAAVGAFSVKSYNQPRRDQRQQIIRAARDLNMLVMPEGGATLMHNLTMIVDGHTGIEHTVPTEMIYGDVLDLWRQVSVGYTPTLSVAYGGLGGENYWYEMDDLWRHERIMSFIPPQKVIPRARRRSKAPIEDYNHIRQARITKKLIDQGGLVQAGGHGQLNGICTHWELWSFVQGGMTPMEALRSGTLHGALYLGMEQDLGTLEPGKLADLIVFEQGANPTLDIRDSERIEYVMANGRIFDAKTMHQLGNHPAKRAGFYWEVNPLGARVLMADPAGCAGCRH